MDQDGRSHGSESTSSDELDYRGVLKASGKGTEKLIGNEKFKDVWTSFINLDILREQVVTVRAVVKHHLVESGCGELQHLTVVVTAIFVFANHPLSHWQFGSLVALRDTN